MQVAAKDLQPVVRETADWARTRGIVSKADVTRLCYVTASLGHRFWRDPRLQILLDTAMPEGADPSRHAQSIVRGTKTWLRTLWAGDDLAQFAARLGDALAAQRAPDAAGLQAVLPGHRNLLPPDYNSRLITWLIDDAPAALAASPAQHFAYGACTLVHGIDWLKDPQCAALAQAVRTQPEGPALAAALRRLYTQAIG